MFVSISWPTESEICTCSVCLKMTENEPLFNVFSDKPDKLQLAVGINVLSILSSEQYFWTKSAESGKCYITLQIHQHAMKINHSHFLTACCRHFTSTALWLCSEVFDNVYMCLKSVTVSVELNSGSSLPVSSTVPFTSHRPHGAAWGSLADRTSKPEQSEQVADRLSRLKRPQVGYWVGLL